MFDDLTDDALLDALDKARSGLDENRRWREPDKTKMREMIDALIARKVYPAETAEGNPNDVFAMVSGWGARWYQWRPPFECPHCKADLRDRRTGPPFKREIGQYDRGQDRTTGFFCPDCKENLSATLALDASPS